MSLRAVTVEQVALACGRTQAVLLRLPVYGHDVRADGPKQCLRHGAPPKDRPGALRTNDADDRDRAVVVDDRTRLARCLKRLWMRGEIQDGLRRRLRSSRADDVRIRLSAQEEGQAGEDHCLSRTGLSGHHGQAGAEGQPRLGDDAKGTDGNLVNHL